MSKLPLGWEEKVSRSTGMIYFYNRSLDKSVWRDESLPAGWGFVCQGESTPKQYFNLVTGETTFVMPLKPSEAASRPVLSRPDTPPESFIEQPPQKRMRKEDDSTTYICPSLDPTFNLLCDAIRKNASIDAILGTPPVSSNLPIPWINEGLPLDGGLPITPLGIAAKFGRFEHVRKLCEIYKADTNVPAPRSGYTALGLAVFSGHIEVALYLLKRGANPLLKNKFGESALSSTEKTLKEGGGKSAKEGAALAIIGPLREAAVRIQRPSTVTLDCVASNLVSSVVASAASALASLAKAETNHIMTGGLEVSFRLAQLSDNESVRELYKTCQEGHMQADASNPHLLQVHNAWCERVLESDFKDPAGYYNHPGRLLLIATCTRAAFCTFSQSLGGSLKTQQPPPPLPIASSADQFLLGCVALVPYELELSIKHPQPQRTSANAESTLPLWKSLAKDASNHTLCELQRLCVHPSARRSGLARTLNSLLEKTAHMLGYTSIILSTLSQFTPARRLYFSCGYMSLNSDDEGVSTSFAGTKINIVSLGKRLPLRHVIHTSNGETKVREAFETRSMCASSIPEWLPCGSNVTRTNGCSRSLLDGDTTLLSGLWDLCWLTTSTIKVAGSGDVALLSLPREIMPQFSFPNRLRCINRVPNPRVLCAKSDLSTFILENCADIEDKFPFTVVFPPASARSSEGQEAELTLSHIHKVCIGTSTSSSLLPGGSIQQKRNFLLPLKHTKDGVWIVKPDYLFGGSGISLYRSPEEAVAHIHNQQAQDKEGGGRYVVQKYIERPLLYCGRKFDIRVNVLLLDTQTVYMYNEGFVRTSSIPYAPKGDVAPLDSLEAHITNNCLQKHSEHFGEGEVGNIISLDSLQTFLSTYALPDTPSLVGSITKRSLFNEWHRLACRLFSTAAEALLTCPKTGPSTSVRIFEVFGLDFLLDEDGRSYLLEVNTNPSLVFPNEWADKTFSAMLRDTKEVVENSFFLERIEGEEPEPPTTVGGWERVWWKGQRN
jgi:ribosomal protein S18 acetylase RimI-like enzyme